MSAVSGIINLTAFALWFQKRNTRASVAPSQEPDPEGQVPASDNLPPTPTTPSEANDGFVSVDILNNMYFFFNS